MRQMKSIATTSQLSKIGDSTNAIMVHCKASTSYRPLKSMEKNKCRSGEEAMIFLLHN
jgi:hypothetical protein